MMKQIYLHDTSHRVIITRGREGSVGIDIHEIRGTDPIPEPFWLNRKSARLIALALLSVIDDDNTPKLPENENVYQWLSKDD